ncbi:small RNA 2'-O-methyltransferase-like [Actinidia eriantha]|uniref:small RNA 2'-O-methyltransferase-like n=1 Tax=Actinidia eriantha TaxID=165200 RepID=UPI0025856410|nr:small RNA 2'-O-methyltransferase-like [Actinidia eriantha]XP_057471736.1 small RNA 2'-O-methyltransferase-like [Actinidia eriantha]XP_057471737.1 small RNA 2'-O-methyltransferase-like [Actinidia eriantha]XP_057471738.1 small RNA 2'-O-methyltransferase-like [Actinidia eriantha]XP_057471739.1 small RNA 2'-O-methyltransferase-like [Actinidia eriantha]XP_057471740.1 small RNA 2'-O-methyltransferase-like [Actinidia eriantha]
METGGPPAVVSKKTSLTPKAIIYQRFGEQACYKVEEVQESTQNECPVLAIPQKGPCLYRCCLQLPEFSVVSETFKKKKEAEQSAAEMALEKLGINPKTDNPATQDPWDALPARLSYLFSNEFLSCLHPLSGHFRAALQRKGHLYGLVPISVLSVYDAKLSSLFKSINPKVESDPLLIMSLMLKVAPRLAGSVSTSEDQLSMQRENPYPPEIIQTVVNQQSSLPESILIGAIRIPCSNEKTVEPLALNVASNDYYLDVIAQELGFTDASKVLVSRTIGKASSEMRLYFCAPKSYLGDLSSGVLCSTEAVYSKKSLNKRASYLSGHLIHGDAILASIGYKWKSADLSFEDVSLHTYYRILIGKIPSGLYKLSRDAVIAAELPGEFTTRSNWRGSSPRDLLCTFCRQHRLSEPIFSAISNPLESLPESSGSHKKLKVSESGNQVINEIGNDDGGRKPVGSRETFRCEVKIFSRCQDLIIECSPTKSFKKQNDAIQNAALKVLSWLNKYFKKLDMPLQELTSYGNVLDIKFDSELLLREFALGISVFTFWQSMGAQEGSVLESICINQLNGKLGDQMRHINIEAPDSGVSPSNGSLACIVYSIYLVTEGEYMKELIESSEEFEFEIGSGSVISCLESVVTQMSVGQSARFHMELPPKELILASACDSSRILPLLNSRGCSLECSTTLLRVTEPLEDRMEQALFTPPLSKQRVDYALQQIKESGATSLVDFGCGSGSLLDSLLALPTSLEKIVGVDISQKGLARAAKILHPKLSAISDATAPSKVIQSVLLYFGSITVFDSRLYGFDIGTCLEVIEHMEEDQAHLFGDMVLSSFCPRILIVSTPNYEYNVILQGSNLQSQEEDPDDKTHSQSCKFRNHDHKFEWTREQFGRWASDLAARHNYSVEFSGVGGAANTEPGFASQIALFRREEECLKNVDVTHNYEVIWEWSSNTSKLSKIAV